MWTLSVANYTVLGRSKLTIHATVDVRRAWSSLDRALLCTARCAWGSASHESYQIISYQGFVVRPLLREPRTSVHYKSQPDAKAQTETQKSTNVKSLTKIEWFNQFSELDRISHGADVVGSICDCWYLLRFRDSASNCRGPSPLIDSIWAIWWLYGGKEEMLSELLHAVLNSS